MRRSNSAVVACTPLTPAVWVQSLLQLRFGDVFLALQKWRLCISNGLHHHVYGGAVHLWGAHMRTTGDDKFPGSGHPRCPYRPISGTAMEITIYTCLHYACPSDQINKHTTLQSRHSGTVFAPLMPAVNTAETQDYLTIQKERMWVATQEKSSLTSAHEAAAAVNESSQHWSFQLVTDHCNAQNAGYHLHIICTLAAPPPSRAVRWHYVTKLWSPWGSFPTLYTLTL